MTVCKEVNGIPGPGTTFGEPDVTEHQRLEMLICLRDRLNTLNTAYFVAIIERAEVFVDKPERTDDLYSGHMKAEETRNRLMLSPVVNSLNKGKFPQCTWGIVWLKLVDDINCVGWNPLDHSLGTIRFPCVRVRTNGEGCCSVVIKGRVRPLDGKLPSNHVQGGTQIMSSIYGENSQTNWCWAENFGPHDVIAVYRFIFNGTSIRGWELHHEHPRFMLECIDVLVRSYKSEFDSLEFIAHGDSRDNVIAQRRAASCSSAGAPCWAVPFLNSNIQSRLSNKVREYVDLPALKVR